jgi:hypothetical protein
MPPDSWRRSSKTSSVAVAPGWSSTCCSSLRALLRRRLELPIQLESSLRQSIAYQLNRLTPFSEADLYFDVVVRERDPPTASCRWSWSRRPRSRVEPLLREMTRLCGREIDRLTTADLGPAANLLGGSRTRFRPNRNFWLLLALLGCLACWRSRR